MKKVIGNSHNHQTLRSWIGAASAVTKFSRNAPMRDAWIVSGHRLFRLVQGGAWFCQEQAPNSGKATYLPTYPHQPTSEIWKKKGRKSNPGANRWFFFWRKFTIYLWRKVVCLFCFVCTNEIHRTRMLQIAFLVSLESSGGGGVHWLGFTAFGLAV